MKFRPLHDRVVIRRVDAEAKTAGGISWRFLQFFGFGASARRAERNNW